MATSFYPKALLMSCLGSSRVILIGTEMEVEDNREHILTADEIQSFHEQGFMKSDRVLHLDEFQNVVDWVTEVSSWNDEGEWEHYRESTDSGPVLARTERFMAHHAGLQQFLTNGRVVEAVGELFGEAACVFKEKINYKAVGGAGFFPHQDAAAYFSFGSLHITCLIAIDANTIDNGCLWFAPSLHRQGLIAVDDRGCISPQSANDFDWLPMTLEPGETLFFSSYAPHKSEANRSTHPRKSLYVTYCKEAEGHLRDKYYVARQERMKQQSTSMTKSENRISTIGHFQGKNVS